MKFLSIAALALVGLASAAQVTSQEKVESPAPWLDVKISTLNYGPGMLNERATQAQRNLVRRDMKEILDFRKEMEGDGNMLPTVQWSFEGEFQTRLHTKNAISWEFAGMTYTGGAHPNHILIGQVLVQQGGKVNRATYSSLFKKESWPKVERLVRAGFSDARTDRLGPGYERKEKVPYDVMNNFTTDRNGLIFLFPHYVMGSYAEGSYTVVIGWDKLVNHMTPQGLILHTAVTRG